MTRLTIFAIGALAFAAAHAAEPSAPVDTVAVKAAVDRALVYLTDRGLAWKNEHGCASCHHVPMMIWSLASAKNAGFNINEAALAETTQWIADNLTPSGVIPADPSKGLSRPAAILLMAPGNGIAQPERLLDHVRVMQSPNGEWNTPAGRAPILTDKLETTLFVAAALAKYDAVRDNLDRAYEWLATSAEAASHQSDCFRLIALSARTGPNVEAGRVRRAIEQRQRNSGGWSQTPIMDCDAYATGQALYALSRSIRVLPSSAIAPAAAFLVRTQRDDGSWPMTSRPYGPDNKGSGNLEPITYAGTAWAVLGLIESLSAPDPSHSLASTTSP